MWVRHRLALTPCGCPTIRVGDRIGRPYNRHTSRILANGSPISHPHRANPSPVGARHCPALTAHSGSRISQAQRTKNRRGVALLRPLQPQARRARQCLAPTECNSAWILQTREYVGEASPRPYNAQRNPTHTAPTFPPLSPGTPKTLSPVTGVVYERGQHRCPLTPFTSCGWAKRVHRHNALIFATHHTIIGELTE